jgi:beta-lactam-binding protein with PASTA domain
MKIRRRTQSFKVGALFSWFKPSDWWRALTSRFRRGADQEDWLDRVDHTEDSGLGSIGGLPDDLPPLPMSPAQAPDAMPTAPAPTPPVRNELPEPEREAHSGEISTIRERLQRRIKKSPLIWLFSTTFAATWIVGYAIAALILFPAPFFTADQTVPDLLGMAQTDAEARLEADGLPAPTLDFETHPYAERREVIWQDPPPGVVVPEITTIQLIISNGPQRIPVPDVSGFEVNLARTLVEATGLTIGRIENVQTSVPKDVTVNARPAPGATLFPGAPVTLVVSLGAPNVGIPTLLGLTREEARDTLEAVGLTVGNVERRTSSAHEPGIIIEQRPGAGTLAAAGTAITIILARLPR